MPLELRVEARIGLNYLQIGTIASKKAKILVKIIAVVDFP